MDKEFALAYGVPRNAAAARHVVTSVILEYPAGQAVVLAVLFAYVAAHTRAEPPPGVSARAVYRVSTECVPASTQ